MHLHHALLPDKLAAFGITGPDIGRLQRQGRLVAGERLVTVEQVSESRRGQRFAFIMDTRLCGAAAPARRDSDRTPTGRDRLPGGYKSSTRLLPYCGLG